MQRWQEVEWELWQQREVCQQGNTSLITRVARLVYRSLDHAHTQSLNMLPKSSWHLWAITGHSKWRMVHYLDWTPSKCCSRGHIVICGPLTQAWLKPKVHVNVLSLCCLLKPCCYPWSMLSPRAMSGSSLVLLQPCWYLWPMFFPKARQRSVPVWSHVNVRGPGYHQEPYLCLYPMLPGLSLAWCLWVMLWQRVLLIFMVGTAIRDHAEACGMCWGWRIFVCGP